MSNSSKNSLITEWCSECNRQAKNSFNLAISFAGTIAVLSVAFALSVFTGKTDSAKAAAALGLTSTAASAYCFKLSDDANKRYDKAIADVLDKGSKK